MEHKDILNLIEEDKILLNHLEKNFDLIKKISFLLSESIKGEGKILIIGNGGSASCAQHLSCELVVKMNKDRKSLPAIALTTDSSILTAVSNDNDFSYVFSRQIQSIGKKNDVLLIFSTSGNSKNLINAAKTAKESGLKIVSVLGKDGGKVKELSDLYYIVPSSNTQRIQEIHNVILHIIVEMIEDEIFKS